MKRKSNNRGFTLVELIIAIAILAIAIAPLVLNFIQSSKLNLKGRKSLNAMNLAQDVMEGLSAYTPEELETILDNMNIKVAEMTSAGESSDDIAEYCRGVMKASLLPAGASIDAVEMTTFDSTSDGVIDKYEYRLKGVQAASSNYAQYDMLLTLDSTATAYNDFNGKELAEFDLLDQTKDAVFTVQASEVDSAILNLYGQSTKKVEKPTDSYNGMIKRIIEVNIVDHGTVGAPDYAVEVRREYDIISSKRTDYGLDAGTPYVESDANIAKGDKTVMPRSVYIYYQGMEGADVSADLDLIKVNNLTGKQITVYLCRIQKSTDKTSNATYNQNYKCAVELVSKDSPTGADNEKLDIVSNLRYDLSKNYELNIRTKDEAGNSISGVTAPAGNGYSNERATYKYNGATVSETVYKKHIQDGYRNGKKNILFEVSMDLYEPTAGSVSDVGTTKKVTSYTGGMSN